MAYHDLRKQKVRLTEEIDIVGASGDRVTVVGECRRRSQQMGREVLAAIQDYKLPALAQTGVDTSSLAIVLFSRSGFRKELREAASLQGNVELIELPLETQSPAPPARHSYRFERDWQYLEDAIEAASREVR